MLISLSMATSQVELPLTSVPHGRCGARPAIILSAYAGTKLFACACACVQVESIRVQND